MQTSISEVNKYLLNACHVPSLGIEHKQTKAPVCMELTFQGDYIYNTECLNEIIRHTFIISCFLPLNCTFNLFPRYQIFWYNFCRFINGKNPN